MKKIIALMVCLFVLCSPVVLMANTGDNAGGQSQGQEIKNDKQRTKHHKKHKRHKKHHKHPHIHPHPHPHIHAHPTLVLVLVVAWSPAHQVFTWAARHCRSIRSTLRRVIQRRSGLNRMTVGSAISNGNHPNKPHKQLAKQHKPHGSQKGRFGHVKWQYAAEAV